MKEPSNLKGVATISVRAQRALATRRRMIQAAYRTFCREGYAGTTMQMVADEADVAVQTLYYTFHNKAALLGDALGGAITGFDRWQPPPADPGMVELLPLNEWWADFQAAATSAAALDVFVDNGAAVLERVAPLVPALHGVTGEPVAAEVVRVSEQRRVSAYREVVGVIARKPPGLRKGLSRAAATDIVVAFFSAEAYRALSDRGWAHGRCTRFFRSFLARELLG